MLYLLSQFSDHFGPLRLFDYVTFRAGGAALTAFLLVILLGGWTARKLKALNAQAATRLEGLVPAEFIDREKDRTPCMGGVLLIGATLVSSVLWNQIDDPISIVLILSTLGFSLIGFYDDFMKVVYKRRDGIPGKLKLLGQFLVAGLSVWYLSRIPELSVLMRQLMVPFFKEPVYTGFWTLPFAAIVVVGASNAVNLTDGKDGLATGCTIFCTLTYAAFAYLMGHKIFAGHLNDGVRGRDLRRLHRIPVAQLPSRLNVHGGHRQPCARRSGRHARGAGAAGDPAGAGRRSLRDGSGFGDASGRVVQDHRETHLPLRPDSPPLRTQGLDRNPDCRSLLDSRRSIRADGPRHAQTALTSRSASGGRGPCPANRSGNREKFRRLSGTVQCRAALSTNSAFGSS